MDPNPDYDASDELEYGFNWFALGRARRSTTACLPAGLSRNAGPASYQVGPVK